MPNIPIVSRYNELDPVEFISRYLITETIENARPLYTYFRADPNDQAAWPAYPVSTDQPMDMQANLYISPCSFYPMEDGSFRKRTDQISQVHFIAMDDWNEEHLRNAQNFPPTWVVETSPDNYQAFYVLEHPSTDLATANIICRALAEQAQADASGNFPARWVRLPYGRNTKQAYMTREGGFQVHVHDGDPNRRYTLEQIAEHFDISLENQAVEQDAATQAETAGVLPSQWRLHLSCLSAIDPDCDRDTWLRCLMVMHAWGEQGFEAANDWSARAAEKYKGEEDVRRIWESIEYDSANPNPARPAAPTIAYLQRKAMDAGWTYEAYSAEELARLNQAINFASTQDTLHGLMGEIHDARLSGPHFTSVVNAISDRYRILGVNLSKQDIKQILREQGVRDPNWEGWRFPLTDEGNFQRFLFKYADEYYRVAEENTFIRWDNTRWRFEQSPLSVARETIRAIPELEGRTLTQDELQQLDKWCKQSQSYGHINALTQMITKATEVQISKHRLDADPYILGTPSFLVSLRGGMTIENTNPAHFVTMHTRYSPSENESCPRWEQFILEIMGGDPDMAHFLKKLAGYTLYGRNPENLFVILHGHGANGKSTFLSVIQHILGDYATTVAPETLTRRHGRTGSGAAPDLVQLYRKRLIVCNEWNENTYINESLLKALAGGEDTITARGLYAAKALEFVPEFLVWLATNHKPHITGTDQGIWRRLMLVPFDVTFTRDQQDHMLSEYLKSHESIGIMNWLIEGYYLWREEGFRNVPAKVQREKNEYQDEMDTVGQYLQEMCEVLPSTAASFDTSYISSRQLYESYRTWCQENGHQAKGQKGLTQALSQRGIERATNNNLRGFKGLRLRTPHELAQMTRHTLGIQQERSETRSEVLSNERTSSDNGSTNQESPRIN